MGRVHRVRDLVGHHCSGLFAEQTLYRPETVTHVRPCLTGIFFASSSMYLIARTVRHHCSTEGTEAVVPWKAVVGLRVSSWGMLRYMGRWTYYVGTTFSQHNEGT